MKSANFSGMLRRLIFSLVITLSAFNYTHSQDYIFNRLSIKDGLLTNNILSIWQDSTGYLWLGSGSGLQRYDGNFFRTILTDRIDQIFSDSSRQVWIRSGNKIGIFNPVSFAWRNIIYENTDKQKDILQLHLGKDASGNVFLIVNRQYCQYYSIASGTFSSKNNPFVLPASLKVFNVIEDKRQDRYWILSQNGLGYWDKKSKAFYTPGNNTQNDSLLANKTIPSEITRLFIDRSNRYWIEAWQNAERLFLCYDGIKNAFTHDTTGLANAGNGSYFELHGITQYDDSVIAVYGMNCLRINDGRSFKELRDPRLGIHPYAIDFNIVFSIFEDRDGIKWFATDDGLYNFRGSLTRNIHGLVNKEKKRGVITSLAEDAQQRLWIGTREQSVMLMTIKPGTDPEVTRPAPLQFPDPLTRLVWSMATDKNTGVLWMGCEQGRLMTYNTQTGQATLHKPAVFDNSTIRQILTGENGVLWLGSENGDLVLYTPAGNHINDTAFRKIFHFDGAINKMKFMSDKRMWVAVNGKGLYLFDTQSKKIIQAFNAGKYADWITGIKDVLPLTDSTWLLAGEQLGFLNMKTSRIDFTASIDNQPIGSAFALQKDQYGNCWIGSSNGIFKFNPQTRSLTQYSQYDGLVTIHNNGYIPETSILMSDNRLAFAGNQHLFVFDPADYRSLKPPPPVTITGFKLNNRYLPQDSLQALKKISISYNQSDFSIEFASMDFSLFGKLTYEYKLQGLHNDWNVVKTVAPVQYNFLPPGSYTFMVRAKNDEGRYSPTTTITLNIVPPFWKTPWFYILIGVLVASILFYLHRLRLQRLLHVEKVRSRLARDLHDDMGSTLSTVNILSNMALQQTPLDEKTSKEFMSTINSSTGQMMEAMDDIVWSINPVNDSMAKILARMKETAGAVLEPVQVEYRFEVDDDTTSLHFSMESRRDIFLIFKEALNNIVKYAHCKNVLFMLQKEGLQFILTIQDDGRGFISAAADSSLRGNGLKNMQKRAENMKGNISVISEPQKGTRITLSMPIA